MSHFPIGNEPLPNFFYKKTSDKGTPRCIFPTENRSVLVWNCRRTAVDSAVDLPSIVPWIFVHIFYPPPSGQIFDQITTFRDIFAQILTFRDIFVRSVFTQILTLRGTSKEKKCTKSLRFATYSRHIRSFCLFKSLRYAAPP